MNQSERDNRLILSGAPEPVNVTEGCGSLGMYLMKRLMRHGDNVAVIDGVYSSELRYLELLETGVRLAEGLRSEAGLRAGDVVGIISENRLEFPVALYASFFANAAVAPINLTYTEREFEHALNLSKPTILFISPYSAERVVPVARKHRHFIKHIFLFGDENSFGPDVVLYDDFFSRTSAINPYYFRPEPTNMEEHVALIMCSSGTTGLPKGVQLTQRNVIASVSLLTMLEASFEVPTVVLSVIPWFHAFGCLTLINVICNKLKLVFLPKFEEGLFLSCIENYRCSFVFVVPPLMVFLAKHPLVDNYDLSSVDTLLCGAAPLSRETEMLVRKRLGVKHVLQGYGMSETTLAMLVQTNDSKKSGSVGKLQVGTMAKVVDISSGKLLGPNAPGELYFKGTQIMKGYIGNETATNETIDKNGWLRTGDIGYYDEDGEFFIVDRLKELIKYKGFQVPPAEIEAILLTNPKIKDAGVVGLPDEAAGELPMAFVVKQPGTNLTEQEVQRYVADRASPAKRLHGGVRFVAEIPKNVSGKILRRELRAMLERPLSKL
ncbi:4-coumarate--CoA ligase 1 [Anopheles stephensi]|uniref:4-coumarate--CoA ligase 1 n=1 Tax=Anopheles stephensi TaxID=30069 RepID=UPI0016587B25|nr:4-coumarate--CoA ligase 1 [Anopheles stephensi]